MSFFQEEATVYKNAADFAASNTNTLGGVHAAVHLMALAVDAALRAALDSRGVDVQSYHDFDRLVENFQNAACYQFASDRYLSVRKYFTEWMAGTKNPQGCCFADPQFHIGMYNTLADFLNEIIFGEGCPAAVTPYRQ